MDTTERLHFHFPLSCVGEVSGTPLQCSCLENPRDGGAWWAAVYGVTESRTRLKRLSSSSSSDFDEMIPGHFLQTNTEPVLLNHYGGPSVQAATSLGPSSASTAPSLTEGFSVPSSRESSEFPSALGARPGVGSGSLLQEPKGW